MENNQSPHYYTKEQLSIKIDRSVATINKGLYHGRLPHHRLGGKVLFDDVQVEQIRQLFGEKKTWNGK